MRTAGIEGAPRYARAMYASLGTGLFEFLWMMGRPGENLANRIAFAPEALEILAKYRADGRGVVVATAHTGNWDLVACAAAHLGPLTVVTKRLSMRSLDRIWQSARAARGVRLLDAEGASRHVLEALARGGIAALLVDQAPERSSGFVVVPFLGRPARCDLTPAVLAARARVPVLVALGRRLDDGTHLVELRLVLEPPSRPSRAWVHEATARIQQAVEAFVREHPSQWLWLHRRWKLVSHEGLDENAAAQFSASSAASLSVAASSPASASVPASPSSQLDSGK